MNNVQLNTTNTRRFFIEVNEAVETDGEKGSVTVHVVHGTNCKRTNKRRLRTYLSVMQVPTFLQKSVLKELGFWGDGL